MRRSSQGWTWLSAAGALQQRWCDRLERREARKSFANGLLFLEMGFSLKKGLLSCVEV
jgi:hypothetical protein